MFNILSQQGNKTLNYFETSSYTIRMANINKTNDNSSWQGCRERGTLIHCWYEYKLVQPLWKSVWQFLRKIGIDLSQDSAIPLLGIYLKDSSSYQRYLINHAHFSIGNSQKVVTT